MKSDGTDQMNTVAKTAEYLSRDWQSGATQPRYARAIFYYSYQLRSGYVSRVLVCAFHSASDTRAARRALVR